MANTRGINFAHSMRQRGTLTRGTVPVPGAACVGNGAAALRFKNGAGGADTAGETITEVRGQLCGMTSSARGGQRQRPGALLRGRSRHHRLARPSPGSKDAVVTE